MVLAATGSAGASPDGYAILSLAGAMALAIDFARRWLGPRCLERFDTHGDSLRRGFATLVFSANGDRGDDIVRLWPVPGVVCGTTASALGLGCLASGRLGQPHPSLVSLADRRLCHLS